MQVSVSNADQKPVGVKLLLAGGIIGPLLNIGVLLVLGATRPGYNAWQVPDSNLALGEGGWLQTTNYLVCGALLLGFTLGVRRVLPAGPGSTWGPILLGLFSVSFIGLGIFGPDPVMGYPPGASSEPTVQGTIHNLFGQLQFISLIAACFVLARYPRGATGTSGRGWTRYSVVTGLLVVICDVGFILTAKFWDDGPAGLVSRVGIVIGWSWIALLAIRLLGKKV